MLHISAVRCKLPATTTSSDALLVTVCLALRPPWTSQYIRATNSWAIPDRLRPAPVLLPACLGSMVCPISRRRSSACTLASGDTLGLWIEAFKPRITRSVFFSCSDEIRVSTCLGRTLSTYQLLTCCGVSDEMSVKGGYLSRCLLRHCYVIRDWWRS